jgi:hypothetical protein
MQESNWLRQAEMNLKARQRREPLIVEEQARAIQRHLGRPEEHWHQGLPLMIAMEAGKLRGLWLNQ